MRLLRVCEDHLEVWSAHQHHMCQWQWQCHHQHHVFQWPQPVFIQAPTRSDVNPNQARDS
eukprot:2104903-Amphidinium_carterae.1